MNTAFDVAVRLSMETSGFASAASMATRLLGDLEGKAAGAEATVAKLARRFNLPTDQFVAQATGMGRYTTEIEAMTAAHATLGTAMGGIGRLAAGAGLVGIGVAGIGVMKGWIGAAGTMQDALAQVGIAAQGTQAQLDSLYTQSFKVANDTQYSASAVLGMDKLMARMNFNDPSGKQTQRQVIHDAIPQFARAAEIAQHFQGTGYEETITGLAQQAHMMGAYSGAALARNVGYSTQLGIVSHMTAQQQANALSYLTPSMKTGQLGTLDAMALVALSNQTGLNQGRGASNLGALMRGLAPTGAHKHDTALAAIERLGGGNFYDAKGDAVPLTTALGILNKFYDNKTVTNERKGVLAQRGLGVQGARAAAVLGSDLSINQFGGLRTRIAAGTPAASEAEQGQLNATLPGQLATLSGNLGSLSALMGKNLLPVVTPLVHGIVQMTGALVGFLAHHEQVAQFASVFTLVGSSAAIVVGGITALSGALTLMSLAAAPLGLELLPLTALVVGLGAAVAAGVWVWQNWGNIVKWAGGVLSGVGRQVGAFLGLAGDLLGVFGQIGGALAHDLGLDKLFAMLMRVEGAWLHFLDTTLHLKDALRWAGSELQSFLRWLGVLHDGPKKNAHPVTVRPAVAPKPGSVHATATRDGTVGLPTTLYLPPIAASKGRGSVPVPHGLPGPGPAARALLARTRQAAPAWSIPVAVPAVPGSSPARHPAHAVPPAPRLPMIPTPPRRAAGMVPAARGAQHVHHHAAQTVHIAPNLHVALTINGADHHDPKTLARDVSAHVSKDVVKELANALSREAHGFTGLVPSSNQPW